MHRNPIFRRLVVATVMFLALFTQFQVLFACEKMEGQARPMCCCDEPGDMSKGCAQGGGCLDQAGLVPDFTDCCEISYSAVTNATTNTPSASIQQVVMLDAPQPPPVINAFTLHTVSTPNQSAIFLIDTPSPTTGIHTYLRTNRFRI